MYRSYVLLEAAATVIDLAADTAFVVDLLGVCAQVHSKTQFSLEGFPALGTQLLLGRLALDAMNEDPVRTQTAVKLEEAFAGFTAVLPS